MKFIAVIVAIIVALIGLSSATICARDNRSGGPQNFASRSAMNAENSRGGGELIQFCRKHINQIVFPHILFFFQQHTSSDIMDRASQLVREEHAVHTCCKIHFSSKY